MTAEAGLPAPRRYAAIAAISLGTILTTVDGSIVNVALPTLARELHVQASSAVLVVTVYQLVMMIALLPLSALSQRLGQRATYQYGQMLFLVATLLCFFAKSLPVLVLLRGLQALGAAAAMSVVAALIRAIYSPSQLGRGLSFNTVIATTAASAAPIIGGAVLSVARWPWLFAIVIPFGLLSIAIGRRTLPEGGGRKAPYDLLGALLSAVMFGLLVSGLEMGVHGDAPLIAAALLTLGLAVGIGFVRWERRQANPVLPIDLLQLRTIALPCLGSLFGYVAMMMLNVALPFRLQQQFHFSPAAAGAALAPIPMMMMVVAPVAGLLSDRIPASLLGAIGMVIGALGLGSLALLPNAPGAFDVMWRVAVCGLGFGMYFPPNARQVVGAAPIARAAAAGALYSTIRGVGQTLGATTVAALLALGVGTGAAPSLIAAALALIAVLCSLLVLRTSAPTPVRPE
ncbi:MFS transporter [Hydrocarboniphaga sp.]|uniref:MFS transporter n=1 Tax=Hydrocarboniphaga sp. TaxID=2033016 RepID=UPI003D0FD91B